MNTNLRVAVGIQGCFSDCFLHYTIALCGNEGSVRAYAFIGRSPVEIGATSIRYTKAKNHIDAMLDVFNEEESPAEGRCTTSVQAELCWEEASGRHRMEYLHDYDLTPDLPATRRAHRIHDLSVSFIREIYPDCTTLKDFRLLNDTDASDGN